MSAWNQRFPKKKRLLKRRQFLVIKQTTKRIHTKHFLFLWQTNTLSFNRLGITITKRYGNSVERNRIRRLLKEVFRQFWKNVTTNIDLVIIAKTGSPKITFANVQKELTQADQLINQKKNQKYPKF